MQSKGHTPLGGKKLDRGDGHGPWSGDALAVVQNFKIIDPLAYYVIMAILVAISVVLVNNLRRSRMGRAWMAVREDEVAAAAMGVNTVGVKLLAFSIGAAFSGFAGTFYGAKLSLVSPENFGFTVSITILIMVVLGGMGNIPGVIVGALLIYYVIFNILPGLPQQAVDFANSIGATDCALFLRLRRSKEDGFDGISFFRIDQRPKPDLPTESA